MVPPNAGYRRRGNGGKNLPLSVAGIERVSRLIRSKLWAKRECLAEGFRLLATSLDGFDGGLEREVHDPENHEHHTTVQNVLLH